MIIEWIDLEFHLSSKTDYRTNKERVCPRQRYSLLLCIHFSEKITFGSIAMDAVC